jgi:Sperm-tail PG-rich repeat
MTGPKFTIGKKEKL